MHNLALESTLGPHWQKACDSHRPFRSLPFHVLLWLVKDFLGSRPQVRTTELFPRNVQTIQFPSRALSGALNGNSGVLKSVLIELTDQTNIASAFSWQPLAWSTGSTLG